MFGRSEWWGDGGGGNGGDDGGFGRAMVAVSVIAAPGRGIGRKHVL